MKLLGRVQIAENQPVLCGIGHSCRADVFSATYRHLDMDGEPMKPFDMEEYEPPTCVTCGLAIWHRKHDTFTS